MFAAYLDHLADDENDERMAAVASSLAAELDIEAPEDPQKADVIRMLLRLGLRAGDSEEYERLVDARGSRRNGRCRIGWNTFESSDGTVAMNVSSLLDTVLAREQRVRELDAERDDEFQTWVKRLNAESMTLLKQISEFDLTDSDDREAFYDLVEKSEARFTDLRNRDEIAEVPTNVTIEIDRLLDRFDEATKRRVIRVSARDPRKERERKKRNNTVRWQELDQNSWPNSSETSTMRSRTTSSPPLHTLLSYSNKHPPPTPIVVVAPDLFTAYARVYTYRPD